VKKKDFYNVQYITPASPIPLASVDHTLARECFKATKQVNGKGQNSTPLIATPKPLNRSSQKLAGVIMSWTAPGMQNFVAIG